MLKNLRSVKKWVNADAEIRKAVAPEEDGADTLMEFSAGGVWI